MQLTDSTRIVALLNSINESYKRHDVKSWGEKLKKVPPGNKNLAKKIREGNVMLLADIEGTCAVSQLNDFRDYTFLTHLYALAPTLAKEIDILDKIIKE